ncbi:hypothetical protein DPEC_G00069780 [Dallia pectoralis]|uniref:Uncharacterized protein n=1 Tax=Dallia pectoralis TaxID=75939 RepID=A0ACC2H278_DALPE|nr:hypothetical protein DPEC_G00069780 [Dallia pectoralis]
MKLQRAATATDVEESIPLPDTPRLIVQGNTLTAAKWLISIEKEVEMSIHSYFVAALSAYFALYYTFNLQYHPMMFCWNQSIHWIKDCHIRGCQQKCGKVVEKKKKHAMNPHVSTLLHKIMDFEQQID